MTELDFEELDKAVNSLMSDVDKPVEPIAQDQKSSTQTNESPIATASPQPEPETPSVNKPETSSLAVKRRGQFMDMVHPSSNMKSAPMPVKRQGLVIAPTTEATPSQTTEEVKIDSLETWTPTVTQNDGDGSPISTQEATLTDTPEPKSEWPDPIDLAVNSEIESTTNTDFSEQEVTGDISVGEDSAPLESPFLPDAKPDKRPLGALKPTDDFSANHDSPVSVPDLKDLGGSATSMTQPSTLPMELHDQVVSIESETTNPNEIPVEEPVIEEVSEPIVEEKPVVVAEVPAPAPVAVTAPIPQQYKEEPSTGDQTNGSIYDTANYHKAIPAHATPSKRHTIIKWIIWTTLLLILGAGGGAAYFMFTR